MTQRPVVLAISSLLGLALLAAGPVAAHHRTVDLDLAAAPDVATLARPGIAAEAGFDVSVRNTSTSTIRDAYLVIDPPSVPGASVVAPFARIVPDQGERCGPGEGTEWPEAALVCRLPRLSADETWAAIVAFATPMVAPGLDGAPLTLDAGVWLWHGGPGGDGTVPSGDGHLKRIALESAAVTLIDEVREFYASYVPPAGASVRTQAKDPTLDVNQLGRGNPLSVVVHVPASENGIPVVILERDEESPREVCPAASPFCIGQVLEFDVPGQFSSEDPLQVFLRWNSTELPAGKKLKYFKVVWVHDDGHSVVVTRRCDETFSQLPCRTDLVRFSDGDWGLTLALPHNGRVRGL